MNRDLIFISYSRQDRVWLDKLFIFLKPYLRKGHLTVWADGHIQVGDRWERKIGDALDRARVGLLLVSPHFLASDFIMEEEVPPLVKSADNGHVTMFCVPISSSVVEDATDLTQYQWSRPFNEPLDLLPEAEQHAELVKIVKELVEAFQVERTHQGAETPTEGEPDFGERTERAVPDMPVLSSIRESKIKPIGAAESREGSLGALHGVPPQRPHFQKRPEELNGLKQALLTETHGAVGITGSGQKLGLHGQGGIGKTVLAIALANDEDIRRAFPDGIFWITMSQEPDVKALQAELIQVFSSGTGGCTTIEQGRTKLQELLTEKSCLLVIDDVWQAEHVRAFDALGPLSRLVVTTRDASVLTALGVKEKSVDVLSSNAALALLAEWSGQSLDELPVLANEICESCGNVPLALALAGAQAREGLSWEVILNALKKGDLEFLDHPYGSIFKSMKLSIEALPEDEKQRFVELAIFPEDVGVPETTVSRLWAQTGDLTAEQTQKLLNRLARKNLLYLAADNDHRSFNFHDLQQDFVRLVVKDAPTIHAQLLNAYRDLLGKEADAGASFWANLPETETYLWSYLAYHLLMAGRRSELEATVKDLRYVAKKLWKFPYSMVEGDIDRVAEGASDDEVVQILRRCIPQAAHLWSGWNKLEDLSVTMLSRLGECQALDNSTNAFEESFDFSYLKPSWPMPDRPNAAMRRVLEGHADGVYCCAIDPTGQWIVSGAGDKTLRVWEAATGALKQVLEGHTSRVNCCAIDPTGQWIVSGAGDNTLRVWEAATGALKQVLEGHAAPVECCAIDPTGQWIVSGSLDKTLRVWEAATGALKQRLEGHAGGVECCAIDPTGQWIVSGSWDNTLRVWEAATGALKQRLEGHAGGVECCAIDPTGQWIVSGAGDNTLRVWEAATGALKQVLEGHTSRVNCCAIDPTGQWIVSGAGDNTLRVWEAATGALKQVLEGHAGGVQCCAIDPTGQWIVSGAGDNTLRVWEAATGALEQTLVGHAGGVQCCAIDPTGQWIVSGAGDNTLRVWEAGTGGLKQVLEGHTSRVNCCAIDPTGQWIVSGAGDNTLRVWEAATGGLKQVLKGHHKCVECCAIDPTGQWIVSGSSHCTLWVSEVATGALRTTWDAHVHGVSCCAIDPTGEWIVSAGKMDNILRVWEAATRGVLKQTLEGHTSRVNCCAIDPTGQWIVSGAGDNTLRVWEAATGALKQVLEGHTSWVNCCAIDPTGQWIVSGAGDKTLRVWEAATGVGVISIRVDGELSDCAWFPDSQKFVAVGTRGVYVFEFVPNPKKRWRSS